MNYETYTGFEVYNTSRLRLLFSRLKNLFSFSFKPIILVNKGYVPYSQYKRNIDYYSMFRFQQNTRLENIKNMPSVGCLE